jgi:SAM-dependent methyltransferase/ribosome modulation factor
MEVALGIIERAKERERNGGRLLPMRCCNNKNKNYSEEKKQEHKDAEKLSDWKKVLKGKGNGGKCSDEVRDCLDKELVGWRAEIDLDEKALQDAKDIVKRAKERFEKGENLLPLKISKKKCNTPQLKVEHSDYLKLQNWKSIMRGNIKRTLSDKVIDYLNINLEGWNAKIDLDKNALEDAEEIVERAKEREKKGGRLIPRGIDKKNRNTLELEQENSDSVKISGWKTALTGKNDQRCCDSVRDYLDEELPGWRIELDDKTILFVKQIVERANERLKKRQNLLPRNIPEEKRNTLELQQECSDAKKLGHLKDSLKDSKRGRCPDEVRDYLDKKLPGWRNELIDKSILFAQQIVERAFERVKKGQQLLPKYVNNKINRNTSELEQMHKDAQKLNNLRNGLNGLGNAKCPDEVRDYLDEHMKGWRPIDHPSVLMKRKVLDNQEETPKPKKSMKVKATKPKKSKETVEQRKERTESELEVLHRRYKRLTSKNLQKEFQDTPELWHKYHAISEENEKSFPDEGIPRNCVIKEINEIKGKRTRLVVDMGCGKAHIADHFINDKRFIFINYDHVSCKENVLVQDISNLPLEDHSVEICILCLAMWGSNCRDYVREAYRILESGGKLYIMEPTKRWTNAVTTNAVTTNAVTTNAVTTNAGGAIEMEVENEYVEPGGKLINILEESGFQIAKSIVEKFCLFVCTKI